MFNMTKLTPLFTLFTFLLLSISALAAPTDSRRYYSRSDGGEGETVRIRIEGHSTTIFEDDVFTFGHNVSTPSGGNRHCDGLNGGENPKPGPTATTALADAAKQGNFTFDGTWDTRIQDFLITRIGPDSQQGDKSWGLLVDFEFTHVTGCQTIVHHGEEILWAFDAFNADAFLHLSGPERAKKGDNVTLRVKDGNTGKPVPGAQVAGKTSDRDGNVVVTVPSNAATANFKAEKQGAIRSNRVSIKVD